MPLFSLDRKKFIQKTKNNKQLNFPIFALLKSVRITTILLRGKHKIQMCALEGIENIVSIWNLQLSAWIGKYATQQFYFRK